MHNRSKLARWTGWVLTGLVALLFAFSASMKLSQQAEMLDQFSGKFGYPRETVIPIAVVELCCLILFLIPRTAVLGAVLLTAYMGGAVATHARVHDPFIPPIVAGVVVWLALFLRDPRIRALLPLRSPTAAA